jgi:Transcription factor WhiB
VTAVDEMRAALLDLADHDQVTPCATSSDAWCSDDVAQRAAAAHACQHCPLLDVCGRYAREVRATFGVYGGRDRTKATRRPPTPKTTR